MIENLIEFLNSRSWTYRLGNEEQTITFALGGVNGAYQCLIDIREAANLLVFVSFAGINCPEEKRIDLLQLFNKLNNYLVYGNFEMIPETGQLKFRTSNYF